MTDTTPSSSGHDETGTPSVAEIAALTARLRALSAAGAAADPAERVAFLADRDALINRITTAQDPDHDPGRRGSGRAAVRAAAVAADALAEVVAARAVEGGYVLVGPSARAYSTDPATGAPIAAVPEAEHRAVRDLLNREHLDTTPPAWGPGPGGTVDLLTHVIPHTDPDRTDPDRTDPDRTDPDRTDPDRAGDREDTDADCAVDDERDDETVDREDLATGDCGSLSCEAHDASARLDPAAELGMTGAEGPPLDSGPTRSAQAVAAELAADGYPPDEARALVGHYLDEVSARVGAPARWWGLDDADLTAIRATAGDPVARARAAVTALPTDDTTATDAAPTATVPADETADETADEAGDEAATGIDRGAQGWSR